MSELCRNSLHILSDDIPPAPCGARKHLFLLSSAVLARLLLSLKREQFPFGGGAAWEVAIEGRTISMLRNLVTSDVLPGASAGVQATLSFP
jgi:hypothetical protein